MKHWIACWLSLLALLVAGCDTVNHSQLQLLAPAPARGATATLPASDQDAVKQVIKEIATSHRFEERTQISLTPGTICSWSQVDMKHPMSIKAWVANDRIAIDIFHRPPGQGETLAYRHFRDEVMSQLKERFGDRLKLVHKMDQVQSAGGNP